MEADATKQRLTISTEWVYNDVAIVPMTGR